MRWCLLTSSVKASGYASSGFAGYRNGVGTLRAEGVDYGGGSETLITMAHGQGGAEVREDGGGPTLTCNHEAPIVCHGTQDPLVLEDKTFPLGRNGGQENVVAYNVTFCDANGRRKDRPNGGLYVNETDVSKSLTAGGEHSTYAVAFQQNASGEVRVGEQAYTLNTNSNASGRNTGMVPSGTTVRRLTPVECERLQGFPDSHTNIPWKLYQECKRKGWSYEAELIKRGLRLKGSTVEECPDGSRYKAIGNSKAVPVIRWVGERIKKHLEANSNE